MTVPATPLSARPAPSGSALRRYVAAAGPGVLVAVGYVDPGNWATDIAGGAAFGYELLCVVVASSLVAILFQILSARLAIATGRDLATSCRDSLPSAAWPMWLGAEIAIVATDFAEVLGSALALQLLFGLPLVAGVLVTGLDVFAILALDRGGSRWIQGAVASVLLLLGAGLGFELLHARPEWGPMLRGLAPTARIARDPAMLLLAVGILGATVMPHNLYLHSSLLGERCPTDAPRRAEARARAATVDTAVSLGFSMLLNCGLLVIAAAAFHWSGHAGVSDIADAHRLLAPLLGTRWAPVVFALALLAAGQSATITATMAGQAVMTGFLGIRWPAWKRRLVTRACAIVPAVLLVSWQANRPLGSLLVGSQVVLSFQLPFALVPLMLFTSNEARMGALVSSPPVRVLGWLCVAAVVGANVALLGSHLTLG